MPYRYPPEFRRRVLDLVACGRSVASVAEDLDVSAQTIYNWRRQDDIVPGSGDPDFLIIADLNSYAQEDPIVAIEGAGYTDLVESFVGTGAATFVFFGQAGYLDHALANASMLPQAAAADI